MSKIIRLIATILPLLLLGTLIFTPSCEQAPGDMEAVVIVKYLGDTATRVVGAHVDLEKNDIHEGGFTDANGEFRKTFQLEAILDIFASADTGGVTLSGASVIRLKPGKTVYRTVYVGQ